MPQVEIHSIAPGADAPAGARAALLCVPQAADSAPPRALAVMLHGAGGHPRQGLDLLAPWASEAGLMVLAPASAGTTWGTVLGRIDEDFTAIEQNLAWVRKRHAVDSDHVVIGGFSDGASAALGLGLAHGGVFKRIVAFSPGFVPRTAPRERPAIFIAHGTHDTVLPISRCSRVVVSHLQGLGYEVTYREFDGGHVILPEISRQAVAWLLRDPVVSD